MYSYLPNLGYLQLHLEIQADLFPLTERDSRLF